MNLFEYARLREHEKQVVLIQHGILIEGYTEKGLIINLYRLFDFFVEIKVKEGTVIDNLPFKRGFKVAYNLLLEINEQFLKNTLAA